MCIPLYETHSVRALFYWSSEMSHSFFAAVLASLRRFTPSLLSTLLTWLLTVETRMFRISPISALLLSAQISRSTCISAAVSASLMESLGCKKRGYMAACARTSAISRLRHFAFPDHSSASSSGSTAAP